MTPPTQPAAPDLQLLAATDDYQVAQRMVDQLSDDDYPVEEMAIVWEGLRHVEHVTGRVTTADAASRGALMGAWFGGIFGWLFAMFSPQGWAVFLTYLVVGALAGAAWRGIGHAIRHGRRDFETIGTTAASEYEVWCPSEWIADAASLLGIRRTTPRSAPVEDRPAP